MIGAEWIRYVKTTRLGSPGGCSDRRSQVRVSRPGVPECQPTERLLVRQVAIPELRAYRRPVKTSMRPSEIKSIGRLRFSAENSSFKPIPRTFRPLEHLPQFNWTRNSSRASIVRQTRAMAHRRYTCGAGCSRPSRSTPTVHPDQHRRRSDYARTKTDVTAVAIPVLVPQAFLDNRRGNSWQTHGPERAGRTASWAVQDDPAEKECKEWARKGHPSPGVPGSKSGSSHQRNVVRACAANQGKPPGSRPNPACSVTRISC